MSEIMKSPQDILDLLQPIPYANILIDSFRQNTEPETWKIKDGKDGKDTILAKSTYKGINSRDMLVATIRGERNYNPGGINVILGFFQSSLSDIHKRWYGNGNVALVSIESCNRWSSLYSRTVREFIVKTQLNLISSSTLWLLQRIGEISIEAQRVNPNLIIDWPKVINDI